jgi:hypothetical protein
MLNIDRTDEILDAEFINLDESACAETLPVTQSVYASPLRPAARPDPTFLAQLIATAEQAPQTRRLRRASLADAQSAYSVGKPGRTGMSFRPRQI